MQHHDCSLYLISVHVNDFGIYHFMISRLIKRRLLDENFWLCLGTKKKLNLVFSSPLPTQLRAVVSTWNQRFFEEVNHWAVESRGR